MGSVMNRNQSALNNLYETLRLVCLQFPNYITDFENDFQPRTELDKKISSAIKESLKTCLDGVFTSTDLLYNIVNAETNNEIISYIDSEV